MANSIPPIPYKTPVINERGFINEVWSKFFLELLARVGGTTGDFSALITAGLNDYLSDEYAELSQRIEIIEKGPVL